MSTTRGATVRKAVSAASLLWVATAGACTPRTPARAPDVAAALGVTAPDATVGLYDDLARDTMEDCTPPVRAVFAQPLARRRRIRGEMRYVGLDPRDYAYDLVPDGPGVRVEVRVHFEGELAQRPEVGAELDAKLARAADLWTRSSPQGFARFRFERAPAARDAHYVIHLAEGMPRTPFDITWGRDWSAHLMAHEIGHMMGLDDEYTQVTKTWGHFIGEDKIWDHDPTDKRRWFHCSLDSLMCDSKGEQSTPLAYHYYAILRRRFCATRSPDFPAP